MMKMMCRQSVMMTMTKRRHTRTHRRPPNFIFFASPIFNVHKTVGRTNTNLSAVLVLQVVRDDTVSRGVLSVVGHHNATAADHFAGLAFLVDAAHAGPLAQLFVVIHLDQINSVLVAQRFNQLVVQWLIAIGSQHTQGSLTSAANKQASQFNVSYLKWWQILKNIFWNNVLLTCPKL